MTDTAATINQEMIEALVMIHRIASRALSQEERVGQRIQRDPQGEINGLLVQMAAIKQLAHAGLPKEGRELLDLAAAKEETTDPRRGAEGSLISFRGLGGQSDQRDRPNGTHKSRPWACRCPLYPGGLNGRRNTLS